MEKSEFLDIVSRTRPKLLAISGRFLAACPQGIQAEDIVQETYIKLWQLKGRLENYKSPEALAVVIAKNICIDLLRKNSAGISAAAINSAANGTATDIHHTEQLAIANQTKSMIAHELAGLPENQRRMILLRSDGMSMEEIAAACGTSSSSVRTLICKGRKKIMEQLKSRRGE